MFDCNFELNGQPVSSFQIGAMKLPAFSGLGAHINKRISACLYGVGPIPPGTYYIFDRESGGLLGPMRDIFTKRDDWFALYAIDSRLDDETFCNDVKRGNFRLHPKGFSGRSEGCVVIENMTDFQLLRATLKGTTPTPVPGIKLKAYGRLVVQ